MRNDILKIYQFPASYPSDIKFVALYRGGGFYTWDFDCTHTIESILDYSGLPTGPMLIADYQNLNYGILAKECANGELEQYCVWSREKETELKHCTTCRYKEKSRIVGVCSKCNGYDQWVSANNPSTFWLVWRTGGDNPEYCHMSREFAEEEADRLANIHPGKEFHVLKAESKYCARGVERVEFHDNSEDFPF